MPTPIRTLVVDDSVFMRAILKGALRRSPSTEVVGSAQNGLEALQKIELLSPDVITLDIEMPGMDGLQVLAEVMAKRPLPVVMVSTRTQAGAAITFKALELGAVDYVAKPLAQKDASLQSFQQEVVQAVESAYASNRRNLGRKIPKVLTPRVTDVRSDIVIAIGISAGGPATLHKLVPRFPASFPPVVLTQHMPGDFTGPFAKRLDEQSNLTVVEGRTRDALEPGKLIIAPGDRHMKVVRMGSRLQVTLDSGPKVSGFRPSVDVLFESVALACGENAIGLIMTGMGSDGAQGIRLLHEAGATTLAQDEASCIVYGMPKAAYQTGCVDRVVSLSEIPEVLVRLLASTKSAR